MQFRRPTRRRWHRGRSEATAVTGGFAAVIATVLFIWHPAHGHAAQPSAEAPRARFTIDEIIEGLTARNELFLGAESFFIDYAFVSSEDFAPSRYGRREAGFHFKLGRRGDMWYTWIEGSNVPLRRQADQTLIFRDGLAAELMTHENGNRLMIKDWPSGDLYLWWQYTDNLFLDIYQFLPESAHELPQLNRPFLPETLIENKSEYRVAPALEQIDGAWCHLVKRPGVDRIWVDGELGFALRRRELYFGEDRPAQTLKSLHYNRDHFEALPGLWLPKTQVVDYYPDPKFESRDVWGKLTNRLTMEATTLEFNSLDDDFFALNVPPDTVVIDQVRDIRYRAQSADDVPFGPALRFADPKTMKLRSNTRWILLVNGLIVGVILAIVLWRRLRQASAE